MKLNEMTEIYQKVYELRGEGKTNKEIAMLVRIPEYRIQAMVAYILNRLKDEVQWSIGLSVRTTNCLHNAGCRTREDVYRLYWDGRLIPGRKATIKGFGRKCQKEVRDWIGIVPENPEEIEKEQWETTRAIEFLLARGYVITPPKEKVRNAES